MTEDTDKIMYNVEKNFKDFSTVLNKNLDSINQSGGNVNSLLNKNVNVNEDKIASINKINTTVNQIHHIKEELNK